MPHRQLSDQRAQRWAPDLGAARLVGGGRTTAMLRRDAVVRWWCAPDFDDAPFCWQLLDPDGGVAAFPDLTYFDADAGPAGISSDCCPRCPSRRCRGWTPTALTPLVRRMPCCARLTAVWGSRVPGCRWRWWAWAVPCGIDSSRGSPRPAGQERARCRGGPLPHCGAADEAQAGLLMGRRDRSAIGRHRAGRRAGGARRLA